MASAAQLGRGPTEGRVKLLASKPRASPWPAGPFMMHRSDRGALLTLELFGYHVGLWARLKNKYRALKNCRDINATKKLRRQKFWRLLAT